MLKAGIVGMPNVGKSTLFNAVTKTRKAAAENYPFCTIHPNIGVVTVPDARLDTLAAISHSEKIVPTAIEFADIAGLVQGASQGEGLGNQFLSHIREVDAIVHVVRCFESQDIHHVEGTVDPLRDIEVINTELILADIASIERRQEKNQKKAKGGDKEAQKELALIKKILPHLDSGSPAVTLELNREEQFLMDNFFLLTNKPTLFACNVGENDLAKALLHPNENSYLSSVKKFAEKSQGASVVAICANMEAELMELSLEDAEEYLSSMGVTDSGISLLIRSVYTLLGLSTFLTTGPQESRAWTIRQGMKAPQAAGVIHSDFERGFIAAEVVSYTDLATHGSLQKCRENGKLRIEGKEYTVKDGDVIEFRFNIS